MVSHDLLCVCLFKKSKNRYSRMSLLKYPFSTTYHIMLLPFLVEKDMHAIKWKFLPYDGKMLFSSQYKVSLIIAS